MGRVGLVGQVLRTDPPDLPHQPDPPHLP